MFWLKKAITFCLMPFNVSLGLLVFGVLISTRKKWAGFGRMLTLCGVLLLLLASNRQVGLWLLRPLELQYQPIPELTTNDHLPTNLYACRYIVVLGGGHADTQLLPSTSKLSSYALGRITEAVRLARLLPEATIITTGPAYADLPSHAQILGSAAVSLGVDPQRFVFLENGRDTENEVIMIKAKLGEAPFALVTSAWHMPRAMALMRHAGLNPLACPTNFLTRSNDRFTWSEYLCGLDGLENSTWAIYERLGYQWARLRGLIDE